MLGGSEGKDIVSSHTEGDFQMNPLQRSTAKGLSRTLRQQKKKKKKRKS